MNKILIPLFCLISFCVAAKPKTAMDPFERYVFNKVDSLSKLPGTKIIDTKKETTIIFFYEGVFKTEIYPKKSIRIQSKNK